MKKINSFIVSILIIIFASQSINQVKALSPTPLITKEATDSTQAADATESAITPSGKLASASAEIQEKIEEEKKDDLTESGGEKKSELAAFLDSVEIQPLTWHNFLQHAFRKAIENGLPANIIVLIALFPVITCIIAFSRHVIGMKGFGIYIPAVLSVAFVSTKIISGIIIFLIVLLGSLIGHKIVKKVKMPYLPRTAMLLWFVSLLSLILLIGASYLGILEFLTINIFPILIIMLLSENFMESQLFNSQKEALRLTLETLIVAIVCTLIINMESVQKFVLLKPEFSFLIVFVANFLIGKYKGLRLREYLRFNSILSDST